MQMRVSLAAGLLVCLLSRTAFADLADEPKQVRTLGMGGVQRSVGTTNETIFANPGGLALRRRYDAEIQYLRDGVNDMNDFNISVLDGTSGPVAGALAYTFRQGGRYNASLHTLNVGFGLPLGESLYVGAVGRHTFGHYTAPEREKSKPSLWSADVGAIARMSDNLQLGISSKNLIRDQKSQLARRDLGGGIAYVDNIQSPTFIIAGDIVWDMDDKKRATAYRAGVEYIMDGTFPLRAGFARAPFRNLLTDGVIDNGTETTLSGGTGIVLGQGALNFGYEHSLQRRGAWQLAVGGTLQF